MSWKTVTLAAIIDIVTRIQVHRKLLAWLTPLAAISATCVCVVHVNITCKVATKIL